MKIFLNFNYYVLLTLVSFCLSFFSSIAFSETPEEKALRIVIEGDNYDSNFGDNIFSSRMTLRNKHGEETVRYFRGKTLEVESDGDKTLFIFDSPRDVKGTASLTFAHKNDPDDQWLYLPALKRVKRITSDNRSGSFVGSEFAYEDIGSQELEKYKDRLVLRDDSCPGSKERKCHVIVRIPVEKSSGYSRQIVWLDYEIDHRVWKIEYYDRKNALLKTLLFSDYKKYLDKFWRASKLSMENHQTGKSTILIIEGMQFKTGLTDKDFNQKSLSRAR